MLPVRDRTSSSRRLSCGIVERAREHADRAQLQPVHDRVQLPEAEMAGEEQHALALRVGEARAILAFELDALRASRRATAC